MNVAVAIDRMAVPVTLTRLAPGSHNADGEWVPGAATVSTIQAVVQPASFSGAGTSMGLQMKDLPGGIRVEAGYLAWSRTELRVNDTITFAGAVYEVVHLWPRAEGGFYRAALGLRA